MTNHLLTDATLIETVPLNDESVERTVHSIIQEAQNVDHKTKVSIKSYSLCLELLTSCPEQIQWLLDTIRMMDLTSLTGDETPQAIENLCQKALEPLDERLLRDLKSSGYVKTSKLNTAAVCVYKLWVETCSKFLKGHSSDVKIAAVAGFPTGKDALSSKLAEVQFIIEKGGHEVDVVIDRTQVLNQSWKQLYDDISTIRMACGLKTHLKVILAVGELQTLENIYRASMSCMLAGADFIKTSTGKEAINATLTSGVVMTTAIKEFRLRRGISVGFKPAGGIKTSKDAMEWLTLIQMILGDDWMSPNLFRFGASSLLQSVERELITILKTS